MDERRLIVISQNVPICPNCSALMWNMPHGKQILYVCSDCNSIFPLIKNGQAENELIVSDKMGEIEDE